MTWAPLRAAKRIPRAIGRVALAGGVEHAHGHDPRAVGQPGDADAVVDALGDGRGDVGAVAVLVVGVGVGATKS